jgi:hypothetical protein
MKIVRRAGGLILVASLVVACGSGEPAETGTGFDETRSQEHKTAGGGVVLSVRSEKAGVCGRDRDFRFGIENRSRTRLTDGLVRFLQDSIEDAPSQTLICGAKRGRCQLRSVAADVTPQQIEKMFPDCLVRLAAGDEFSCRAAVGQSEVHAALTAQVGGAGLTTQADASCQPPPASVDLDGALTVTAEKKGVCGADRTFRFGVRNPTAGRLTDILMRFPRTEAPGPSRSQTLICGASRGSCELRSVGADVSLERIAEVFPECFLRLAPDDQFSCRVSLDQARVDASLTAMADGSPVSAVDSASCEVPSPPPDECAGMLPESVGDGIEVLLPPDPLLHQRTCDGTGTTDEAGNFALTAIHVEDLDPDESSFGTGFFVTAKDGKAEQIGTMLAGSNEGFFRMFAQPSGFTLFSTDEGFQDRALSFFSHEGEQLASVQLTNQSPNVVNSRVEVGSDPAGGMAAVRWLSSPSNTVSSTYQRFDSQGHALTDEIDIQTSLHPLAVGVDLAGNALVITGTNIVEHFEGRWFSRRGKALTGWFAFEVAFVNPPGGTFMQLEQIASGSLILRHNGKLVLLFRDAHERPEPLPAWLADRSRTQLAVLRGGRAHASWGRTGSCGASRMEMLTSSGHSCGCVTVPNMSLFASVGRDGSVIVTQERVPPPAQCSVRLFPQLLK